MRDDASFAFRRSLPLWVASGVVLSSNVIAGAIGDRSLIFAALALTALYALYGIVFGIRLSHAMARRHVQSVSRPASRPGSRR